MLTLLVAQTNSDTHYWLQRTHGLMMFNVAVSIHHLPLPHHPPILQVPLSLQPPIFRPEMLRMAIESELQDFRQQLLQVRTVLQKKVDDFDATLMSLWWWVLELGDIFWRFCNQYSDSFQLVHISLIQ